MSSSDMPVPEAALAAPAETGAAAEDFLAERELATSLPRDEVFEVLVASAV